MAQYFAAAVGAARRQRVNGALKTVERVRLAVHQDLKRLVVLVPAGLAAWHLRLLHRTQASTTVHGRRRPPAVCSQMKSRVGVWVKLALTHTPTQAYGDSRQNLGQ